MSNQILNTKINFIKGIGNAKAELLKKELSIVTYENLLKYLPFRHVDRRVISPIGSLTTQDSYVQISGFFKFFDITGKANKQRLEAIFYDQTGSIKIIWFQNFSWVTKKFQSTSRYFIFGKIGVFKDEIYLAHPEILTGEEYDKLPFSGKFQPIYQTTEKLKKNYIDSKKISQYISSALDAVKGQLTENLPDYLLKSLRLPGINEAYENVHMPTDERVLDRSLKRFRFEEALLMQLRAKINLIHRKKTPTSIVFRKVGKYFNSFYHNALNFELTNAQKRVTKEIRADLGSGYRMNRLLQGDVGSGKTVVAMMAALIAIDNGYQTCIMAPTEILAQQHFNTISKWVSDLNLKVEILTGNIKGKKRKEILKSLEDGSTNIIIGTHALIESSVIFQNLGLAIIDEQHRFGVMQRAQLSTKNTEQLHTLVMTATPIPRTLALTIYGELDVSILNELPPGRKEVVTKFYYNNQRIHALDLMRKQIEMGHQAYIVYPLIKESEKLDLIALEIGYEAVVRDFPMPKYETGIMHGRMTQEEKDFVMDRFSRGITDILVSTTVIEVGVDVPNASIMIIENAERFGLSQLHQLRGRVGRGKSQSYCVLIGGEKLTQDAKDRLRTMLETTDGFKIAEADLNIRGEGDILGTRQSGDYIFENLVLARDEAIITHATKIAQEIAESDPNLSKPEHLCLKKLLISKYKKGFSLSEIA